MGTFLTILKIEMKRALKSIPYFLAGAVVLALLAGATAFSANRMLYADKSLGKIQVGVVIPKEDQGAKWIMSVVSSLESVSSLCEFTYIDEAEGRKKMEQEEIYALMLIPDRLLEGIMDGTNEPVTIVFPEQARLEAAVFRELTEAGTEILKVAQAAIYGTDELLGALGRRQMIPTAESELNRLYLKYALSRSVYFKTSKVSASGDVSTEVFYGISASVLVLLLLGIPAAGYLKPFSPVMEKKLYLAGFGRPVRILSRTLCLSLLFWIATAVPFFLCLKSGIMETELLSVVVWSLVCLAAAGWVVFIYEICQSTLAGISVLFLTTLVMMFMAGGLIPSVFLPKAVAAAGRFTPVSWLMEAVRWMTVGKMTQAADILPLVRLLFMEAALFALSVAVRRDYE